MKLVRESYAKVNINTRMGQDELGLWRTGLLEKDVGILAEPRKYHIHLIFF